MSISDEKKQILLEAASNGHLRTFQEELQDDAYLLHETTFPGSRNLLHIATIGGHTSIVKEVLRIDPMLVWSIDSEHSTALHFAAAHGNVEVTEMLLEIYSHACFEKDCRGMNPVHVAAMNGNFEVLDKLLEQNTTCFPQGTGPNSFTPLC